MWWNGWKKKYQWEKLETEASLYTIHCKHQPLSVNSVQYETLTGSQTSHSHMTTTLQHLLSRALYTASWLDCMCVTVFSCISTYLSFLILNPLIKLIPVLLVLLRDLMLHRSFHVGPNMISVVQMKWMKMCMKLKSAHTVSLISNSKTLSWHTHSFTFLVSLIKPTQTRSIYVDLFGAQLD